MITWLRSFRCNPWRAWVCAWVFLPWCAAGAGYRVTESWSATLEYRNFAGGVTKTDRYSGQQTGTIDVNGGQYQIIDKTGVAWSAPGREQILKTRSLSVQGATYAISGDYVFLPAFGARAYGLVFIGCFAVKVPLVDGEVPAFTSTDRYDASGPASAVRGGGNMLGSSLRVTVSSTVSLQEVIGPPVIAQAPRSLTIYEGQTATFSVTASGRGPFSYAWKRGSTFVPAATNSVLTITNARLADAGPYTVVVTNAGGTVTSAAATLTVKPAAPPWFEGWETATLGSYYPKTNDATTLVVSGTKPWVITDTVSSFPSCGPPRNHADIVEENGERKLKLVAVDSGSSCADNIEISIDRGTTTSLPVPLAPGVPISWVEQGHLENPQWNGFFNCVAPPCGDTVHLTVIDDLGNHVVYVFQRATNYVEHTGIGYTEIFLDPAGGAFQRDLYADFARIAGAGSVGTRIESIAFGVAAAGWATLDHLVIGSTSTNADRVNPTLVVTAPADLARLLEPSVTLQGTAADNAGVAAVEYRLENAAGAGEFQPAAGTTRWSATIPNLIPGTNVVRLRAIDVAGRVSTEVVRRLIYVATSPLTLGVEPPSGGSVRGATNQQRLELGRSYTLTATPATGFLFSHWSGDVASSSNALTFTMSSNVSVQANFVTNRFPGIAGGYGGLFYDAEEVRHESSGSFDLALQASGAFSARLQQGAAKMTWSGTFDAAGRAEATIQRPGSTSLQVALALDLSGAQPLTGRVAGLTWSAPLTAERRVFDARTNPAGPFTNRYTMAVAGRVSGNETPGGDGVGSVLVKPDGVASAAGVLADGTPLTQSAGLSGTGRWPFYASLYGGRGSIFGWLQVRPTVDVDLAGELFWLRPPGRWAKVYTNGFEIAAAVTGSIFRPFGTNRLLAAERGELILSGGDLLEPVTNRVAFGNSGRVADLDARSLKFSLTPTTGLWKGSLVPAPGRAAVSFNGVLLQGPQIGRGFHLGPTRSGAVELRRAQD